MPAGQPNALTAPRRHWRLKMHNSKKPLLLLVITVSLLTGCAGASASKVSVCPPVSEYSREFEMRLADELDQLPLDSAVGRAATDHKALRDQLRKCPQD